MTGRVQRLSTALSTVAVAALLAAVGTACSSSSDSTTTTTSTSEATTTTTVAATTTSTTGATTATTAAGGGSGTPTTTAGGGGTVTPTDPQAYATAFVQAWVTGDHNTALGLGTQQAVNQIFAFDSGGASAGWHVVSCEGAAGSSFCTFNAGGDPTVVVQVGNEAASQGQLHAVTQVQVHS